MTGFPKSPGVVPLKGAAIVIHATEDELSHMGDFVRDMHTKTGLP